MLNSSIANFFAILLQYNSKHRIALFTNCKKINNILLSYLTRNFSLIPLIFLCSSHSSVSFSICSLLSETSLPKFLTHLTRPLSHLSSHGLSSLIARLLSHCTGAGFWIFEVGGWISVDWRAGFGSLAWDWLIDGWIIWVDH